MAGVPPAALGAGPPDSRDADGFIKGSHLLLELQQSERKEEQLHHCRKTAYANTFWANVPFSESPLCSIGVTNVLFEACSPLPCDSKPEVSPRAKLALPDLSPAFHPGTCLSYYPGQNQTARPCVQLHC